MSELLEELPLATAESEALAMAGVACTRADLARGLYFTVPGVDDEVFVDLSWCETDEELANELRAFRCLVGEK